MKRAAEAFRLLEESNPVADDAFAGTAADGVARAAFEHIIASPASPARTSLRSLGKRRLLSLAVVTAGAAVVAGLLPGVLSGSPRPTPPRLTRPVHTAWEPARPLPASPVAGAQAPGGSWRLASYLVPAGWRENTAGPEPGPLTCPAALTCYVEGDNAASASGPGDMDTLYVTYDGAASWNALPLPEGITFTSALSCGPAVSCAAGALYHGQPVLATTANGAHSWTIVPLPAGDGQIFQLDCQAATTCAGLASPRGPLDYQWYVGVKFLSITDGGRHFATFAFPAGALIQAMTCPTSSHCVALGVNSLATASAVALSTSDGGAHWIYGRLPAGRMGIPGPPVTCADASHCFTILGVPRPDELDWTTAVVTADGGRTWIERPFPASVPQPQMYGIACPTATTCFTSGQAGQSPAVLITRDAGLTWSAVTFARPAHVPPALRHDPNAFLSVGDIQCPQPDACIALGAASQGSKATAVYTYRNAP